MSHLSLSQRLMRLKVRIAEIAHWRVREKIGVVDWSFDGAPIALGDLWPRRDGVVRLACRRGKLVACQRDGPWYCSSLTFSSQSTGEPLSFS